MRFLRFSVSLLTLFVGILACFAFTPGANAQNTSDPNDVTVVVGGANPRWGIPDRNATSPSERARRTVFDAFSRKYPHIKLSRYSSLALQGPAAESGILMAYAGGAAPDIVYVNFRQLRNYVGQGFLRPIDDLLAQNPDAMERVQPAIKKELLVDGKYYSVPYAQYVQALYYRKDLFRAAGLDPNHPPANWDEFYSACQALTNQNKGQWGFAFETGEEAYYWINFLWSAGGDIARPKSPGGPYNAVFNTPEGVTALEYYRKLMLAPWKDASGKTWKGVATRTTTRKQDITSGKIGMWFAYQSDDIANMNQFDLNPSLIGIAPMPKGPTGLTANEMNAAMWGINSAVKDPKNLRPAGHFCGLWQAKRPRKFAPALMWKTVWGNSSTRWSCIDGATTNTSHRPKSRG